MRPVRLVAAWTPVLLLSLACGLDVPSPEPEQVRDEPEAPIAAEPVAEAEAEPRPTEAVREEAEPPAPAPECPPFRSRWGAIEGQSVDRATMGEQWPFTVDAGCIYCDRVGAVVFVHDGRTFGVNGAASTEYGTIDEIWADSPDPMLGPKINIGPLLQRGLALCA